MAVQSGDLEMIKMCLDNGAQLELMEVIVRILHETFYFRIVINYFPKRFRALLLLSRLK